MSNTQASFERKLHCLRAPANHFSSAKHPEIGMCPKKTQNGKAWSSPPSHGCTGERSAMGFWRRILHVFHSTSEACRFAACETWWNQNVSLLEALEYIYIYISYIYTFIYILYTDNYNFDIVLAIVETPTCDKILQDQWGCALAYLASAWAPYGTGAVRLAQVGLEGHLKFWKWSQMSAWLPRRSSRST